MLQNLVQGNQYLNLNIADIPNLTTMTAPRPPVSLAKTTSKNEETRMSTENYECFDVTIADGIAHIELNRPDKFNSMIPSFWTELPQIVDDISAGAKARVIVVSSSGKHFCSGMDLAVFAGGDEKPDRRTTEQRKESMRLNIRDLQHTISCLDEARMPVLMAIQGGCIGGGVDLSSAADCRYITKDGFFCIQEINIGMTADVGTFPRLCHLLPQGILRELSYTGRRLLAHEAKALGLVNEIYDTHDEMLEAVMATAKEIASKSPLAVTGSKVMMNYARDHTIADGLDYIAIWQTGMFQPAEMGEAFMAKAEKRAADFPDLVPLKKGLG
jgi:enoyl-CoA hydratase